MEDYGSLHHLQQQDLPDQISLGLLSSELFILSQLQIHKELSIWLYIYHPVAHDIVWPGLKPFRRQGLQFQGEVVRRQVFKGNRRYFVSVLFGRDFDNRSTRLMAEETLQTGNLRDH